jgi:hypothetical protein
LKKLFRVNSFRNSIGLPPKLQLGPARRSLYLHTTGHGIDTCYYTQNPFLATKKGKVQQKSRYRVSRVTAQSKSTLHNNKGLGSIRNYLVKRGGHHLLYDDGEVMGLLTGIRFGGSPASWENCN